MREADRLLHRLYYETRDWCRQVQGSADSRLSAHRDSVQARPEVWPDE